MATGAHEIRLLASRGRGRAWRWLEAWHLLSLDAPTVAVTWALLLARSAGVRLDDADLAVLGLGTWLVYVADRLLDARPGGDPRALRERHRFYARRRSQALVLAACTASAVATVALTCLRPELRSAYVYLFALALGYFALIHRRGAGRTRRWKEAAVGVLFASACAAPAWTKVVSTRVAGLPGPGWTAARHTLAAGTAMFAALCWLNCTAIEHWESTDGRRAGRAVPRAALALALVGTAAALAPSLAALGVATAGAALILLALDRTQTSPRKLRPLADVALLTPLAILLL